MRAVKSCFQYRLLLFTPRALQQAPLPEYVVQILARCLPGCRCALVEQMQVAIGQLPPEERERHPVGDEVVHAQQNGVLLAAAPDQCGAKQRSGLEIERPIHQLVDPRPDSRGPVTVGQVAQVFANDLGRQGVAHDLHGAQRLRIRTHLAAGADLNLIQERFGGRKGRSQDRMPFDHDVQGALEQRLSQRAVGQDRPADAVRRTARCELLDEPQPLLIDREGPDRGVR